MSQDGQDCGCKHPPRRVLAATHGSVAEPLLVVAEDAGEVALGCGDGGCPTEPDLMPPIRVIRFERACKNGEGAFEVEEKNIDVPQGFGEATKKSPGCLPWVKISRDGDRFRSCLATARRMGQMSDSSKLYTLIKDHAIKEDQEVFYVILLDTQLYVRGISELTRGARDRVMAPIPDVLRLPIVDGAMAFAVAHNHPSGKTKPSDADAELTKALSKAARAVDLLFIDHIVIGADGYYSFKDHGKL